MSVEMVPIETCGEILDALLVIQIANKPKPVVVKVDMRKHRKALSTSSLMNHLQKFPEPSKHGKTKRTKKPKTKY